MQNEADRKPVGASGFDGTRLAFLESDKGLSRNGDSPLIRIMIRAGQDSGRKSK